MSRRDLILAVASGVVLVSLLAAFDSLDRLGEPWAVAVGVGGGLLVESAFLLGTRAVEWWERPAVPPLSALVLVAATVALAMILGPVVVAATCWGLATYVVALAGTVLLAEPGPPWR